MTALRTIRRVAGLALSFLMLFQTAWADDVREHLAGSRAANVENCVEPTDDMRRNHMKYLLHQRDATMYEGIRTKQHSLAECVDCHVKRDSGGELVPINAEGQFCQTCHNFASVSMDCFQCHATVPREPKHRHSLVDPRISGAHHKSAGAGEISVDQLEAVVGFWKDAGESK